MARYLIVNADDFNLTEGVTRGILAGHRRGIITSTTVMVNLPGLERTRDLAREAPGLDIGLHVNFTLGPPILPASAVASLVDPSGHFVRDRERVGDVGALSEIRDEAAAQAKRFEEVFGRRATHLDTHYHTHRLPRVFEAVLEVAEGLRLPVRAVTPEMALQIRGRGLPAPDRMVGDVGAEAYWTAQNLVALAGTLEEGVTELMCHPGYADDTLSVSSYCAQRDGELQALCDPRVKAALGAAVVALIGYRDLAAGLERRR
ncbi:MAG: ChbG/HpnK family deacetylase [Zetaproteobacteria bacterium]|nr:MAG: ChbG/HpnK family deacetylase [Zetaproteobacteria bacterium]